MKDELSECRGFSEKSHPIYKKLFNCTTKSKCLVDQLNEVIPISSSICALDITSTLFIQYSCKILEVDLLTKRTNALLASSICIFFVLLLFSFSDYGRKSAKYDTRLWDLQTKTVGDYTLEVHLTKQQVIHFYSSLTYEEKHTFAPLYIMKVKMAEEMESQLKDQC